jgi:hypothetical protein
MGASILEKQPAERFWIGADFNDEIDPGESLVLSGSTCTESNLSGGVVTIIEAGTLTLGPTQNTLLARVSGGTNGDRIKITMRAATDAQNIYEHDIIITLID